MTETKDSCCGGMVKLMENNRAGDYFSHIRSTRGEVAGNAITSRNRLLSAAAKFSRLYQEAFRNENLLMMGSSGETNSAISQRFENKARPSAICSKLSERWKTY